MNLDAARRVADTVLYEGYLLYPYRASAQKNRSRWQFGVLMPPAHLPADPYATASVRTECVLESVNAPVVDVVIRFLQIQRRSVQRWDATTGTFVAADAVDTPDGRVPAWDEAVEQEFAFTVGGSALTDGCRRDCTVPGGEEVEDVRDPAGTVLGRIVRTRRPLSAAVSVTTAGVAGPWRAMRLDVRVENTTPLDGPAGERDDALPAALVATHTIIGVTGGAFVSMVDPPEWAADAVAACTNVGVWPVLLGPPGQRDAMLSAPIILYDHVTIAPESPGNLFDGTEIDEILTLRTLALSDAEKQAARLTDPRAAALIDRTDAMDAQTLGRLHGTIRDVRTAPEPATDTINVTGHRVGRGTRVRLRPGARRSDAQDMFLAGRPAVVEAVLQDVDDNQYVAVTLADDPGADLKRSHGRFLYFMPDEIEPVEEST